MNNNLKSDIGLNEFDKAFESARFFQSYHLSAFSYFIAISGGGLVLLASNISIASYATLFSFMLLLASLAFYLYNQRIERHMVAYYELSRKIEAELGMTRLLQTQDSLQVRLIGFTYIIRGFYLASILIWLSLAVFHLMKWIGSL